MVRKYKGESLPENKEIKRQITQIHFLIHPGYSWLFQQYKDFKPKKTHPLSKTEHKAKVFTTATFDGFKRGIKNPHFLKSAYQRLMQMYEEYLDFELERAGDIGPNTIVIVFLFGDLNTLKRHFGDKYFANYATKIRALKQKLGPRLIVFSDNHPNKTISAETSQLDQEHLTNVANKLKQIASARNFEIPTEALSEAYGEEITACVAFGASNLNRELGLKSKTQIIPEATSLGDPFGIDVRTYNNFAQKSNCDPNATIQFTTQDQPINFREYLKYIKFNNL